jgi:hypothetical protein
VNALPKELQFPVQQVMERPAAKGVIICSDENLRVKVDVFDWLTEWARHLQPITHIRAKVAWRSNPNKFKGRCILRQNGNAVCES